MGYEVYHSPESYQLKAPAEKLKSPKHQQPRVEQSKPKTFRRKSPDDTKSARPGGSEQLLVGRRGDSDLPLAQDGCLFEERPSHVSFRDSPPGSSYDTSVTPASSADGSRCYHGAGSPPSRSQHGRVKVRDRCSPWNSTASRHR